MVVVKRKLRNPRTGKLLGDVYVRGKGIFRWNSAYKVYNNIDNYDQLSSKDVRKIDYSKSE